MADSPWGEEQKKEEEPYTPTDGGTDGEVDAGAITAQSSAAKSGGVVTPAVARDFLTQGLPTDAKKEKQDDSDDESPMFPSHPLQIATTDGTTSEHRDPMVSDLLMERTEGATDRTSEGGTPKISKQNATDGTATVKTDQVHTTDDFCDTPRLWVGSDMQRCCKLKKDKLWKVGRDSKSNLMLKDPGVSSVHFKIRWDGYKNHVELVDSSSTGTWVNSKLVHDDSVILRHGDWLEIKCSKTVCHQMVLDLRPIGLGMSDPREGIKGKNIRGLTDEEREKKQLEHLLKQRTVLLMQVKKVNEDIAAGRQEALDQEKKATTMQTDLTLKQIAEDDKDAKVLKFLTNTERLEQELGESRDRWLAKLSETREQNEADIRPLTVNVAETQRRIDKLRLQKVELERSLHPERFAVAAMELAGSSPSKGKDGSSRNGDDSDNRATESEKPNESGASGEEEAFADVSKPHVPVLPAADDDDVVLGELQQGQTGEKRPLEATEDGESAKRAR